MVISAAMWVCLSCMLEREHAEPQAPCGCNPAHTPWIRSDLGPTDVARGLSWAEHADPAECEQLRSEGGDCESDYFSWSSCDACGCPLGGERFAYTDLTTPEQPA